MEQKKSNFGKFLLLWSGELISAIGSGLTSFGIGVYVFNQTGSAGSMAIVTLLAFLPTFLLSAPAGVLADRYDRRILMILGDGLSGIGIVYILICMLTVPGGAKFWQICIGITISAIFSSLLEPSYRATVTDLLTPEEYSKASGMVSLAGSARYLVSPVIAGILLSISTINLLLVIDACTIILTVAATTVVRKGLESKQSENNESFMESFKAGWKAITEKRGIFILIMVSSIMTCFLGVIQILCEPMILAFSDSKTLGVCETFCACGMLVSSLYLGIKGIKKGYVKVLSASLALAGVFMVIFGLKENIYLIAAAGFFFFVTIPFANNCLDYLVRINIDAELQGRVWGLIGFLSQIGYIVAYTIPGFIADAIGKGTGIGVGRGSAIVIIVAGVLLAITSASVSMIKEVRKLEHPVAAEN